MFICESGLKWILECSALNRSITALSSQFSRRTMWTPENRHTRPNSCPRIIVARNANDMEDNRNGLTLKDASGRCFIVWSSYTKSAIVVVAVHGIQGSSSPFSHRITMNSDEVHWKRWKLWIHRNKPILDRWQLGTSSWPQNNGKVEHPECFSSECFKSTRTAKGERCISNH